MEAESIWPTGTRSSQPRRFSAWGHHLAILNNLPLFALWVKSDGTIRACGWMCGLEQLVAQLLLPHLFWRGWVLGHLLPADPWKPKYGSYLLPSALRKGPTLCNSKGASYLPLIQVSSAPQQRGCSPLASPICQGSGYPHLRLTSQAQTRDLHFHFALSPTDYVAVFDIGLSMGEAWERKLCRWA